VEKPKQKMTDVIRHRKSDRSQKMRRRGNGTEVRRNPSIGILFSLSGGTAQRITAISALDLQATLT